jgi:hypothetical protein
MHGQHSHTDNLRLCGEHNATDRLAGNETVVCEDGKPFHCLQIDYSIPTQGRIMKNTFLDYLTAIAIGLLLCIGALHYFDVLVK